MTDKDKIKQKIEKRIHFLYGMINTDFGKGVLDTLNKLKDFIDSLPEEYASEDLEEAAYNYCEKVNHRQTDIITNSFKAGYEKGRFDMQQEMMKDAVDATILDIDAQTVELGLWPEKILDIKEGDKVKIIICKMSELYYWQDFDKLLGGRLIQFACELMQAEGLKLPGNTNPDKQNFLYDKYKEHVQSFINQYGKELITLQK